jgi:hypothetical protein
MRLAPAFLFAALACSLSACAAKRKEGAGDKPAVVKPEPASNATGTGTGSAVAPVAQPPLPPLAADPGGATGKPRWTDGFGGPGLDAPRGLAIDDRGDIFVSGLISGEASFGALGSRTSAGKTDALVMRLEPTGEPTWAIRFGGAGEDVANAIAQRGDRVLAVGSFYDKLSVQGPGNEPPLAALGAGSDDIFAVLLDSAGSPQWVWTAGGRDTDGANAVAATPDGGWVIGGSFSRHAQFGTTELDTRGRTDAILIKLTAEGTVEWVKQFGGRYADAIWRVAVDAAGNIIVQGLFADVADWGGGPLKAGGGSDNDVVLAKYDRNGTHLWSKRFGSAFNEVAGGLAVDPAGFITMTGSFDQKIDFGNGEAVVAGESDIFVARFAPTGELVWSRTYGGDREDIGFGVAADANGNVVVAGWFEHTVDFGGGAKASFGNRDAFVLKLDAAGRHVWSTSFGDRDHDQARAVALDRDGRPVIAGIFRFDLKVDPGKAALHSVHAPAEKAPEPDLFVTALER